MLGISTATLVFFGDYVQKTMNWLFEKRESLSRYQNALGNMGRVFLKLIFLQMILFWSLISVGTSALFITYSLYFGHSTLASLCSLALFIDGMLSIMIWMILFVLNSTPGRETYGALVSEIEKTRSIKRP